MDSSYLDSTALLDQPRSQSQMRCYVCNTRPAIPMQCRTCNIIKCFVCFKAYPDNCQTFCASPDHIPIYPRNDAQYQQVITLRCKYCDEGYNIAESEDHDRVCKGYHIIKAINEVKRQQCRFCFKLYPSQELSAHEKQCNLQAKTNSQPDNGKTEQGVTGIASVTKPRIPLCQRICTFITGLLSLGLMATTCYFAIKLIFFNNPEFKIVCVGGFVLDEGICLFAFGQFAVGIINISQFGIGLIHIGQIGIGLLFGFGQVTSGIGWSFGQIASSSYVHRAQVGIAFYSVGKAQCGFEFLQALMKRKTPFVESSCGSNESAAENGD